jgi:hypothetical protein
MGLPDWRGGRCFWVDSFLASAAAARRSARFIFSPHAKAMISRKKFQSWCPQYGQGFFGIGKLNHAYLLVLRKFCTGPHFGQKLVQHHALLYSDRDGSCDSPYQWSNAFKLASSARTSSSRAAWA